MGKKYVNHRIYSNNQVVRLHHAWKV